MVLPEGQVECEDGCESPGVFNPNDPEQMEAAEKDFQQNWMQVDWSKVETLKDLIAILAEHGEPIFIKKGTPEHQQLNKFLKPIQD
ncbi:MAG: hypothetical protein WCH99_04965 [Verrucomicrobiota bacterium]